MIGVELNVAVLMCVYVRSVVEYVLSQLISVKDLY